jgi:hypothetical protein
MLDPAVVAAFLGGSHAAGTADGLSDLDLYLITDEEVYAEFFARRREFMATWGQPVLLEDVLNFEGLGFDMLVFILADGVWGEVALAHTGNFMNSHGGPTKCSSINEVSLPGSNSRSTSPAGANRSLPRAEPSLGSGPSSSTPTSSWCAAGSSALLPAWPAFGLTS